MNIDVRPINVVAKELDLSLAMVQISNPFSVGENI